MGNEKHDDDDLNTKREQGRDKGDSLSLSVIVMCS